MSEVQVEHQLNCPYALLDLEGRGLPEEAKDQLICPDRRCCVWLDLKAWFGLETAELPTDEFRLAFTDIAHGGSGLYEKLIVLGQKALETFSEMYIYEQFDPHGVPADLLGGAEIPEETLPTETSCVKFVKACIGYSIQLPQLESRRLFEWLPTLTEHIYWAQKLKLTNERDEDNETLQDIQEYFGYAYSRIIPRIREALSLSTLQAHDHGPPPTGRDLIRYFAFDYFRCLADEAGVPVDCRAAWVTDETENFIKSPARSLFAGCWLNLSPYMATQSEAPRLPSSDTYVSMFEALLSACYVLSSEEKSRAWMGALVHRLRQIQLTIQLRLLDLLSGGPTAAVENFQNVDIHRWSSLSNVLQKRLINWSLLGLDDVSMAALQFPLMLPSAASRQAEREGREAAEESAGSRVVQDLGSICSPCLRGPFWQPPEPRIQFVSAPDGRPIELIPLRKQQPEGKKAPPPATKKAPPAPPTTGQPEGQRRRSSPGDAGESFWNSLTGGPVWGAEPSTTKHCSVGNALSPTGGDRGAPLGPPIFKVNRVSRPTRYTDCWTGKLYDADGNELWRPPGAILMRRRSRTTDLSKRKKIDTKLSPVKSSPPSVSGTTSAVSTTTSASEDMKLDIRYSSPPGERPSNRPVEAVLYKNEWDIEEGKPPVLRAVMEMSPEQREQWERHRGITGTDFRASIYRADGDSEEESDPVRIAFAPKGPTGTPRVYLSGPGEIETTKGKATILSDVSSSIPTTESSTTTTTEETSATTPTPTTSSSDSSALIRILPPPPFVSAPTFHPPPPIVHEVRYRKLSPPPERIPLRAVYYHHRSTEALAPSLTARDHLSNSPPPLPFTHRSVPSSLSSSVTFSPTAFP